MRLPDRLERLLATLESLDRSGRIEVLVDVARRFRRVPERIALRPYAKEHLVPGCESEAYVWAEPRPDGTLTYHFAVENPQGAVVVPHFRKAEQIGQHEPRMTAPLPNSAIGRNDRGKPALDH